MSRDLEFPRPIVFDDDYWLCRCEGFRVESPTGRVGVVAEVRFESRVDRPDELVVRGGLFGNRVIAVAVAEVIDVLPRQQRIVISAGEARQRHERPARLRAYLAVTLGGG
jgi:hypothetical protein